MKQEMRVFAGTSFSVDPLTVVSRPQSASIALFCIQHAEETAAELVYKMKLANSKTRKLLVFQALSTTVSAPSWHIYVRQLN